MVKQRSEIQNPKSQIRNLSAVAPADPRLLQIPENRVVAEFVFEGEFLEPLEGDGIVMPGACR